MEGKGLNTIKFNTMYMKTKRPEIMKIKLDTRESFSTKATLHKLVDCEEGALLVGDILIDDTICFEHKKPADFISSVFDGRLFDQIEAMKENYPHSYVLVSGNIEDIMVIADAIHRHTAIIGAICSCFRRGCPVVFCGSIKTMADMLLCLGQKHTDGRVRSRIVQRKNIEDKRVQLLCSIGGVSTKTAVDLLERFGSVIGVLNASDDELQSVYNIGEVTSRNIIEVGGNK